MWSRCATITMTLLLVSTLSKIVVATADTSTTSKSVRLFEKAIHWYNVAHGEKAPLLKLQHYATALAFAQAAREFVPDAELECAAGVSIPATVRDMEQQLSLAREHVAPASSKTPPAA